MTKVEAIEHMKAGRKVTHRLFEPDEWISMVDGRVTTEEGYSIPPLEFWMYRTEEAFDKDWELFIRTPQNS